MSDEAAASILDGPLIVFGAPRVPWSANARFGLRFDPCCQFQTAFMRGTVSATLYRRTARPFGRLNTCDLPNPEQALRVL